MGFSEDSFRYKMVSVKTSGKKVLERQEMLEKERLGNTEADAEGTIVEKKVGHRWGHRGKVLETWMFLLC